MGDYVGAVKLSKRAKRWIMWSVAGKVVSSILLSILVLFYMIVVVGIVEKAIAVDNTDYSQ